MQSCPRGARVVAEAQAIARARGERSRGNACQRQARTLEEAASFHRSISYAVLEARTEFEAALRFGAARVRHTMSPVTSEMSGTSPTSINKNL